MDIGGVKLDQLMVFLEVVERQSFAQVALERNLSPSSVSRMIQTLESQLGLQLFHRTTRSLHLTEEGELYHDSLKPILESLQGLHQRVQDSNEVLAGNLRITLPPGLAEQLVIPLLAEFTQAYPEISLELMITDKNLDLEREKIDIGIRVGRVNEPNWIAKPLTPVSMFLCAPPNLPGIEHCQHPEQLKRFAVISFLTQTHWQFSKERELVELKLTPKFKSSSVNAVHQMCLQGMGVALLPNWLVAQQLKSGDLVQLLADYELTLPDQMLDTWLIFPKQNYLPKKTRVMLDFLYTKLKKIK